MKKGRQARHRIPRNSCLSHLQDPVRQANLYADKSHFLSINHPSAHSLIFALNFRAPAYFLK